MPPGMAKKTAIQRITNCSSGSHVPIMMQTDVLMSCPKNCKLLDFCDTCCSCKNAFLQHSMKFMQQERISIMRQPRMIKAISTSRGNRCVAAYPNQRLDLAAKSKTSFSSENSGRFGHWVTYNVPDSGSTDHYQRQMFPATLCD